MQITWRAGLLTSLLLHCSGVQSQDHPHGRGPDLPSRGSKDNEPLTRDHIRQLEKGDAKLNQPKAPVLWTRDFGNCMNDPAIEVQSFNAAYHAHNMTVSFSFKGNTTLVPQYVLIYLVIVAYREPRFELIFDPCKSNLGAFCPAASLTTIEAKHEIPVSEEDVSGIPEVAFSIPDFEGRAVFRIFSNSTFSQVGCISAVVQNGHSFSQPKTVIPTMAIVTIGILVVGMSSWLLEDTHRPRGNAITGLPVSLYFSVMHTIYFTGALSINFPSNLIAFWSNFAWMVGIIHIDSMQKWILPMRKDQQTHINTGAEPDVADLIYRLYYYPYYHYQQPLGKRFTTYGSPTQPGIPIPGSYYGFRSTLAASKITGANAFTTSGSLTLFTLACLVILYGFTRFVTWIAQKYILKRQEPTCSPFVCSHNFFAFMMRMIPLTYFHILTMAFFEITHKEQHVRVEGGFGIAFPILYKRLSVTSLVEDDSGGKPAPRC
ncbi:ML-like domain-containing protein [Terfezia claveryi]|nr:ML-like domain-containing protein [Terfezia claveryi]